MNGVTHNDFSGKVDQVEMPDMDFGTVRCQEVYSKPHGLS